MKSKTKILIAVAILIVAGAIVMLSIFNKPSNKALVKGTTAMSDQAMSKKSIQLRNEFTKDTLELKRMIQILRSFEQFTERVTRQIDTASAILKYHPLYTDQKLNPTFIALQEYSNFLNGNMNKLKSTEAMLTEILANKDESNIPYNVEMNLHDFANFINQMTAREAIMEQAALEIDIYLDKSAKKKMMQIEISELQNFRSQLLMDNRVTFAMLGNKTSLTKLSSYAGIDDSNFANADDAMSKP
ncbi:MAG: hypothetical protein PHF97_02110 [Bacteroidales bacterium]|nr:hypothetical protein [Bacteroidales bacterium]MDD4602586.1 hypothetical protein [Bacteroidales bacterium]